MTTARTPRPGPARPAASGPADTGPRDERARGRELALLALCHLESYPHAEHPEALALLWRNPPRGEGERGGLLAALVRDEPTRRRAAALLQELWPRLPAIDQQLTETSVRWRLSRMAQVDRNVLRLAAFELAARPRTPRGVVLAEAVRLARRYGSERSPSFVNGLAEALARRLRPDLEPGLEPGLEPETEPEAAKPPPPAAPAGDEEAHD